MKEHATLEGINFPHAQKQQLHLVGLTPDQIDYRKFRKAPGAEGSVWAARFKGRDDTGIVILAVTENSGIAARSMIIPAADYDVFAGAIKTGSIVV